jgi:hypothetical protein
MWTTETHNEEIGIKEWPSMSKSQPPNKAFDRFHAFAQKAVSVPKTVTDRREAAYQKWRKALRKALRKARA